MRKKSVGAQTKWRNWLLLELVKCMNARRLCIYDGKWALWYENIDEQRGQTLRTFVVGVKDARTRGKLNDCANKKLSEIKHHITVSKLMRSHRGSWAKEKTVCNWIKVLDLWTKKTFIPQKSCLCVFDDSTESWTANFADWTAWRITNRTARLTTQNGNPSPSQHGKQQ